jgi:hypothetical protein
MNEMFSVFALLILTQKVFIQWEATKIHGVCMHHDLGVLGAAFNKEAARFN